jgi:D-beta-D-heptose 7-phosphate kinase/D-beta-D-heptose 1-phosphate adenosyltransferase
MAKNGRPSATRIFEQTRWSANHPGIFNFEDALKLIPEQTIVCVGDLMLDDFVYGEVSRISPKAPAPILAVSRNELTVGGAGNVARNIAALGARCIFLGVVGEDGASRTLMRALASEPLIEPHLVVDAARPTTRKVRFVSEHHSTHLVRAESELAEALNAKTEKALIDRTLAALPRAASGVLSDYAKGTLTPRVIREVIDAARKAGIPIIVDPKADDYSVYRDATVIKPNKELSEATRQRADSDADVIAAPPVGNRGCRRFAERRRLMLVPAEREPDPRRAGDERLERPLRLHLLSPAVRVQPVWRPRTLCSACRQRAQR